MVDDGGGSEQSEAERCRAEERGHETFMHLGILLLLLFLLSISFFFSSFYSAERLMKRRRLC